MEKDATSGTPTSRRLRVGLGVLGLVVMTVGLVLVFTAPGPASFGWTAYAPLTDVTFSPGLFVTGLGQAGLVLTVAGFALLTFCMGWTLGLRQARGAR